MKTVFKGVRFLVEVTLHPQRSCDKMDRLLCALIILILAAFYAPATNAEDENISSNEDLGIKNDDPVKDDEDLLENTLTEELNNGKKSNIYAVQLNIVCQATFFVFQIYFQLIMHYIIT